ncbi:hypothetical protein BH11PLA1_BH11PLA1_11210 [soil metagenome]
MRIAVCLCALAGLAASAQGALVTTRTEANQAAPRAVDNVLGVNEYGPGNGQSYGGNNATGFGGPVGNGTLYMGASATNLQVGFTPGANLNDIFCIYFSVNTSASQSFLASNQSDNGDGSRRVSTGAAANGVVTYPIAVQYTLVFGNFGAVLFALRPDSGNPAQIQFLNFDGAASGASNFRETSISLASIGATSSSTIDFFGILASDSRYLSNESMPSSNVWSGALDGGTNPGFNPGTLTVSDYNRFQVPTPGAAALLGLGGLVATRRRRA